MYALWYGKKARILASKKDNDQYLKGNLSLYIFIPIANTSTLNEFESLESRGEMVARFR